LDVAETSFSQSLDEADFVDRRDRPGLDLEAFTGAFFVDLNMRRQVGHSRFLRPLRVS
jgi:hypothetical protein